MDEKEKLKPLPKPVAAPFNREKSAGQNKPPAHVPNIDPDDFEIPDRTSNNRRQYNSIDNVRQRLGREPIRGKRLNESETPTFGKAVGIFIKRLRRRLVKSVNTLRPPGNTDTVREAPQESKESRRQARLRKKRRKVYARLTGLAATGIFIITLFIFLIMWLTGKNAYKVTLGEETIGYIALSEGVTAANIQAQAVSHLEGTLGAKVQSDSQVEIEEVHVGSGEISEDDKMIDLLSRNLPYKIAAAAIMVEGQEIALLKTSEEADAVIKKLQERYVDEELTKEVQFVEDVKLETRTVTEDEPISVDEALLRLDKTTTSLEDYVIQEGDTLYGIAVEYGTTLNEICANTPGLTPNSIVKPGQIIKLETEHPYLSVRTIDEVVRKEVIPMQNETQDNPMESKSYVNVIQEGREGEDEVTVRITRVNGVLEKDEEIIDRKPIVKMEAHIVEVGTQELAPR